MSWTFGIKPRKGSVPSLTNGYTHSLVLQVWLMGRGGLQLILYYGCPTPCPTPRLSISNNNWSDLRSSRLQYSSRKYTLLLTGMYAYLPPWMISLRPYTSHIGTSQEDTLLQILEADDPALTQTPPWRQSIHSIQPRNVMPPHSNHAPIKHCQVWKYTSILSGRFMALTVALPRTLPLQRGATLRMCTLTEM